MFDLLLFSCDTGTITACVLPQKSLTLRLKWITVNVCVVVQFYPWFKFSFLLFLGMVMNHNDFETKESKILTKNKIEPQHNRWWRVQILFNTFREMSNHMSWDWIHLIPAPTVQSHAFQKDLVSFCVKLIKNRPCNRIKRSQIPIKISKQSSRGSCLRRSKT